jgi:hypothetical protein
MKEKTLVHFSCKAEEVVDAEAILSRFEIGLSGCFIASTDDSFLSVMKIQVLGEECPYHQWAE